MTRTPLVLVEEHHEAFYVWQHAIRRGWLNSADNTLLHVDEHSDMSLPHLRRTLDSIHDDASAAEFTCNELDIGNFIWPAVYQGIFNRVLWLRHQHARGAGGWRQMSICARCKPATRFVTGSSLGGTPYAAATDIRTMEYAPIGLDDTVRTDQPVVLDIDLDYFCWNEYPDYGDRRVEITRAAYEDFVNDRYHFLRIAPGSKVSAAEREGRYYLCFNDDHAEAGPAPESAAVRESIVERIHAFVEFLRRCEIRPALAVVCRSLHSGYTPRPYASFIERNLLGALAHLSDFETVGIAALLPGASEDVECALTLPSR